jgi:auxin efflux carrier family protein
LTIFLGFFLSRKKLFPPAASQGVSVLTMNAALPALIFSSMVPAFTPANSSAIGPLALIAVVYVLIGFVFGIVIREVCYVPRNFWQGIVVASALSGWANIRMCAAIRLLSCAHQHYHQLMPL